MKATVPTIPAGMSAFCDVGLHFSNYLIFFFNLDCLLSDILEHFPVLSLLFPFPLMMFLELKYTPDMGSLH